MYLLIILYIFVDVIVSVYVFLIILILFIISFHVPSMLINTMMIINILFYNLIINVKNLSCFDLLNYYILL